MLNLQVKTESDVTVIEAIGRLTMASAAELGAAIDQGISSGSPKVVIDLEGTVFVDSSGLGSLVSGLRRTREAGGDLRIVAPTEQVATVLSLTNLDKVLIPYTDVEAARHDW